MKKTLYFMLLAGSMLACQPSSSSEQGNKDAMPMAAAPINVQLLCESTSESEDDPHHAVFAVISDSKAKIAEVSVCDVIPTDNYAQYQIPADALAAVGGWWAGMGEYIYAQRNSDGSVSFYAGSAGESEEESALAYRNIATYANGSFSVTTGELQ